MGAAEDHGVERGRVLQVVLRDEPCDHRVGDALLDDGYEEWTGARPDLAAARLEPPLVRTRLESADGADHTDAPCWSNLQRRLHARFDHAPERDGQLGGKGRTLQRLARVEVGGTPATHGAAYRERSPARWLDEIASSGVPLQMWWSDADEIVTGQRNQSGKFFADLRERGTAARLERVRGSWSHTATSYRTLQLPGAARWLGLLDV